MIVLGHGASRASRLTLTTGGTSSIGYTAIRMSARARCWALTRTEMHVANQIFATLDPTSRRVRFPREREVIVTDTVGFIRDLPPDPVLRDPLILPYEINKTKPFLNRRLALESLQGGAL